MSESNNPEQVDPRIRYNYDDFTESNYRRLLEKAKARFRFVTFDRREETGSICILRHDLDFSVHRALASARIENELGIRATYFILLHSPFYNVLESDIKDLIYKISELGHEIALHFDGLFYPGLEPHELPAKLEAEKKLLQELIAKPVTSFSFHTPTIGPWMSVDDDEIAGLLNAYGKSMRSQFTYCSDSNGYWRHRRLEEVIDDKSIERLYILTHPEWWCPEVLSPRERIMRAVQGRSVAQLRSYEEMLKRSKRPDIG